MDKPLSAQDTTSASTLKPTSTTKPTSTPTPVTSLHADVAIEWAGDNVDVSTCYLIHSESNPVELLIHPSLSSKTVLFRLRIVIEAREVEPANNTGSWRMPVFLYLPPDRIRSINLRDDPSHVPEPIQQGLRLSYKHKQKQKQKRKQDQEQGQEQEQEQEGRQIYLQFALTKPADLILPVFSFRPTNKAHGNVLDSVRLVAGLTAFTIHLRDSVFARDELLSLCKAVSNNGLALDEKTAGLSTLYRGRGGRVVDAGQSSMAPPPPSYDEAGPPPPLAPLAYGKENPSHINTYTYHTSFLGYTCITYIPKHCRPYSCHKPIYGDIHADTYIPQSLIPRQNVGKGGGPALALAQALTPSLRALTTVIWPWRTCAGRLWPNN